MRQTTFWSAVACCLFCYMPLKAQSWLQWQDESPYLFPEKSVWIFPKNIENFKTAQTQIWVNNQWRDSIRFNNVLNANGLVQSTRAEIYDNGLWLDDGTSLFTYNATGQLIQLRAGLGAPASLLPFTRVHYTLGAGERVEKSLAESYDIGTGLWTISDLDSNIYAPTGQQLLHFNMSYDSHLRTWELFQKDSMTYQIDGKLDKTFIKDPINGYGATWDGRYVRTYDAGRLLQLRYDIPAFNANGAPIIPLVWDSIGGAKRIDYTYNAQNQVVQMTFQGKGVSDNPFVTMIRYRFALAAHGKVNEELHDEFNRLTQTWSNVSKTTYTYYRTSMSEIAPETALTVAPNPVRDGHLHLAIEGNGTMQSLELYDVYGRSVFTQNIDNQNNIDLNLDNTYRGQYVLRVQTDQGLITKKILFLK
jgi:hypothetical protein